MLYLPAGTRRCPMKPLILATSLILFGLPPSLAGAQQMWPEGRYCALINIAYTGMLVGPLRADKIDVRQRALWNKQDLSNYPGVDKSTTSYRIFIRNWHVIG